MIAVLVEVRLRGCLPPANDRKWSATGHQLVTATICNLLMNADKCTGQPPVIYLLTKLVYFALKSLLKHNISYSFVNTIII